MSSIAHVELWKRGPAEHSVKEKVDKPKKSRKVTEFEDPYRTEETRRIVTNAIEILTREGPMAKAALAKKIGISKNRIYEVLKTTSDNIPIYDDFGEIGVLIKDRL